MPDYSKRIHSFFETESQYLTWSSVDIFLLLFFICNMTQKNKTITYLKGTDVFNNDINCHLYTCKSPQKSN